MSLASERAIRIISIEPHFSIEQPSGSFAFGNSTLGNLTLAHVRVHVADRSGRESSGWGAMLLSHGWAFPGTSLTVETKDRLMRQIINHLGLQLIGSGTYGHPLDHFLTIEPELEQAVIDAGDEGFVELPHLASLVAWSPVDAAIHDAYGNLHGVSSYDALGPDYVTWNLGAVLGNAFEGRYLSDMLRSEPTRSLAVSHTVGAADPLTVEEKAGAYPSLTEWIAADGAFSFKVKLKGQDLDWDTNRLIRVFELASHQVSDVRIFGDLNEQGPSLEYIMALLDGVESRSPAAFAALDALEQPSSRQLGADAIDLSPVSALIPIVLDEGLTSLRSIDQAVALGWNGIALKACKTQSLSLLALAKATELGMHVSVQDLTNPGIALIQSLSLASRLPSIVPIESNQRQYFPDTSNPEKSAYPDVFTVQQGRSSTAPGTTGLGYGDLGRIDRGIFRNDPA